MLARLMFAAVNFAARNGLQKPKGGSSAETTKLEARRTGIRGETYAYWYLRRQGYVMVARNFIYPGMKGEIDMVGYDGETLAFIEVKTRAMPESGTVGGTPEEAVNWEKRRNLERMARQFIRARRLDSDSYRFDIVALETRENHPPTIRLQKGAFVPLPQG